MLHLLLFYLSEGRPLVILLTLVNLLTTGCFLYAFCTPFVRALNWCVTRSKMLEEKWQVGKLRETVAVVKRFNHLRNKRDGEGSD